MAAPKSNKQKIIDSVIKEIEKGTIKGKALAKIGGKWRIAPRTFDRYWKTANEQHTARQQAINAELLKVDMEGAIEARKRDIADALERKEILTQIMRGQIPLQKAMVVDSQLIYVEIVPDWMDRKNAIAELNKMDGAYEPTKTEVTGKNGEPLYKDKSKEELADMLQSVLKKLED